MAVMENAPEPDPLSRIWDMLNELGEQLSTNRKLSITLHSSAGGVKTQAVHSQTGFVFRRYNLDKPKELYDAELERMNAAMSAENQTLMNDNKQLNVLIKDYESTLESVMATFRTRANEVQQQELALMRDYERKLLIRETEELIKSLSASTSLSETMGRLGTLLRSTMRSLNGEDPDSTPCMEAQAAASSEDYSSSLVAHIPHEINSLEAVEESMDAEKDRQLAAAEWSLERECELARLEQENDHLRKLLAGHMGVLASGTGTEGTKTLTELPKLPSISKVQARIFHSKLGGREVGPFGMFKKFDETG